jgi:hypothetical protein
MFMPEISRFYGIVISIRFRASEHNPPHFHAVYGKKKALFEIKTLRKIDGDLPETAEKLVTEWAKLHKSELLKIWESQIFTKIAPLD